MIWEDIQQSWQGVLRSKGQAEAVPSSWRNMCRHLPSGLVGNCSHIMVHGNPQCDATAGDTVLAAQIGSSFYVICREV